MVTSIFCVHIKCSKIIRSVSKTLSEHKKEVNQIVLLHSLKGNMP